jgi:hypothetical protein
MRVRTRVVHRCHVERRGTGEAGGLARRSDRCRCGLAKSGIIQGVKRLGVPANLRWPVEIEAALAREVA